ncbi:MAG: UDP-galactopyranose mutase [Acholeplasma sp.]|nr:UDP-galactopyranose mutase [Acholeplasma sp.]
MHLKQASPKTIISKEFPFKWEPGIEPYYPITDQKHSVIYNRYLEKTRQESKYLFGGRLATYQYLDMHVIVEQALELVASELN